MARGTHGGRTTAGSPFGEAAEEGTNTRWCRFTSRAETETTNVRKKSWSWEEEGIGGRGTRLNKYNFRTLPSASALRYLLTRLKQYSFAWLVPVLRFHHMIQDTRPPYALAPLRFGESRRVPIASPIPVADWLVGLVGEQRVCFLNLYPIDTANELLKVLPDSFSSTLYRRAGSETAPLCPKPKWSE